MYPLIILLLATAAAAQPAQLQPSHTQESLRGVSAVTREIAWASGTHGTYLRTTDGKTWVAAQVPNAEPLDFRGVVAFSAKEAFLMSSGEGDKSRIYHTTDAGQHWQLQFTPTNPKAFFDSMAFWDPKHGIVLGDPIPDETGKLKFELLATDDGETWHSISASLPEAIEGEGAFAASNSCIAILAGAQQPWKSAASAPDPNIWFATGGKAARVFHSADAGKTWQVVDTPIIHGPDSAGIFSISFENASHGVISGGDYKHPDKDGPNLAFTSDGGRTWTLSRLHPQVFFSAATFVRPAGPQEIASSDPANLFLAGPGFIFDFRHTPGPSRIQPRIKPLPQLNALSPYPTGGALAVGAKGAIFVVP